MNEREYKGRIEASLTKARDIAATAEKEDRELTGEEQGQIEALVAASGDDRAAVDKIRKDATLNAEVMKLAEQYRQDPLSAQISPTGNGQPAGAARNGAELFASADYQDFLAKYSRSGHIPDSVKGLQSSPIPFNATLITGDLSTSAGALVIPDQTGIIVPNLRRPLTVLDLITKGTTGTDMVEYVRVTAETNNAAPVAEATGADDGSGEKPESAMTLARIQETVKTIAHWIPATKRALSDAGQVRTLIDNFLMFGLQEELEDQVMTGSGVGENFTGLSTLATAATLQTQAWDTDILKTARKAKTLVRTVGRDTPTAYVMNPTDWETIDLLQDNEGRYYAGGPFTTMTPRLWGLPVIESEAVSAGTAYVANWKQAVLWDREQASITVSDSHADFFVRNLVALLAELRAAFGVIRPKSFVQIDTAA